MNAAIDEVSFIRFYVSSSIHDGCPLLLSSNRIHCEEDYLEEEEEEK